MDPVSILGIVSASSTIIAYIGGTIKNLNDARGKFGSADLTIKLLISELSTIKNALNQIRDWAEYNLTESQARKLGDSLETTLDGCKVAMEILAEDVADLVGADSMDHGRRPIRLGFRDKARLIWNESAVKDHQDRLGRQTAALHFLLTVIQCQTISEQTNLLRSPENAEKIQKIADDTSTIRAARSQTGSTGTPSIRSQDLFSVASKAFPWDDQLVASEPYQRALGHHRTKSDLPPGALYSKVDVQIHDPPVDEGYETMSKATAESTQPGDYLSPTGYRDPSRSRVQPYETGRSVVSDSDNLYRSRSLGIAAAPFASDSSLLTSPASSPRLKELGKKKSFWSVSLRRKSDSMLENSTTNQKSRSPTPGSRRGIRGFENNFHTSIDFASPQGMNCPQIVRAAQAGSIVEIETLLDGRVDIEECHRPTGRNAMAVAAHCGNANVVELLLRYGAKVSMRDASSSTPLHLAASRGHTGVMTILLSERAHIEDKGPDDRTPLRLSCDNGHFEAAELLLLHQARANARDKSNLTSLHAASKRGNPDIVSLLIRHGADIEAKDGQFMAALHHAAEGGHTAVVELLLNKKADMEMPGNDGKSPLVSAAAAGAVHVVELLLRRKASLKKRGAGEMTALHWAAFNGHVDVVDLLLQKKAPVNMVNIDGRTALHLAVMSEQFPVVELLLRKNAIIEAQCKLSLRPLHYACGIENVDVVRLLLSSGAQLEAEGNGQQRPLHLAATKGLLPVVMLLLENGAKNDVRDAAGDRPLLLATSSGHTEVVKAFLDRRAPIRAKFTAGPSHEDSPICVAARNGHADIVTLLLSRGASVREKDEFDWPPLRYAAHYGHPDVVERLLMNGASLSSIQSWGFNLTADRIGFTKHVDIPEGRKESVVRLLREAEEREKLIQERQAASSTASTKFAQTAAPQSGASELDHGIDISRPPLRELFSPDNTRYATESDDHPPGQLEPGNPSSLSGNPGPNGAVPTSASAESGNGPNQTAHRFTLQERVPSAISSWSNTESTFSSIRPPSTVPTPFSYSATPPAVDMRPTKVGSALNSEEIGSSSTSANYQDTKNAWNGALAGRSAGPMTRTSLESVLEDDGTDSTTQVRTSLPDQNSSPSRQLRTVPPSWSTRLDTTNTLTLEGLRELVKERRRGGFSFLPGPGSLAWHLADVEKMVNAYHEAGVTHVELAEDGYRPTEPPQDQHVSSFNTTLMDGPFGGPLHSELLSNHSAEMNPGSRYPGSPSPPTRPPPAPPSGAVPTVLAGLNLKSTQRFASSSNGIFEMPASVN